MEDKKYHIELKVLTPLSVGAGNDNDWIKGLDFIQKDRKVYVLDLKKAASQGVSIENVTNLFLKYDDSGISQLLGNRIENASRFIFHSPVSTTNNIKTFLRTQLFDKPIVPGSSVKGAIRSALFKHLRSSEKTNVEVFGSMKDGTDFMRFIRISDIEMPSTILVNTKIFNLRKDGANWYGGWKHGNTNREGDSHTDNNYKPIGFNTLYECVEPGMLGYGNFVIASNAYDLLAKHTSAHIPHQKEKNKLMTGTIRDLFMAVNMVTKEYLEKEKAFFETYTADRSEEILRSISKLLSLIPADGSSCLLKMSAGVGFHSITGDWQYDDFCKTGLWEDGKNFGKKKYKSRKVANYRDQLMLMGFIKLRLLTENEAQTIETELQAKHHQMIEDILNPIKQREYERQQILIDEQNQRINAENARRNQETIERLIEKAQQAYLDENWDESLFLCNEAIRIFPDNEDVIVLLERAQKSKTTADFHKKEQEEKEQKFSQPLAAVIKDKTSAGNLVGWLEKWVKTNSNSFGDAEYLALLEETKKLSPKELKKMKSKRQNLLKAIGKEMTEKLFNDLSLL